MKIGIGADHAGQRLKGVITEHLKATGHRVVTFGPETTPDDDYPLIVRPLSDALARGDVERGIFFCGSGIGPAVAANKIAGVRAAVVENEWSARDAVEHVDVNLLTLGERVIGEELAKSIVDAYLEARVQGGRHERRRGQITALERSEPLVADGEKAMGRGEMNDATARPPSAPPGSTKCPWPRCGRWIVDMHEHLLKHRGESTNGELGESGQRTDLEAQETASKRVPKFQATMRARRARR